MKNLQTAIKDEEKRNEKFLELTQEVNEKIPL